MTVSDIKALLQQEGLTPNKALGQNFLVDEAAALRIAEASGAAEYPVLEIGPGLGALTEMLLRISPHVAAVEIDAAMVRVLQKRFGENGNFSLLHEDFLKTDLAAMLPLQEGCTVAANLPYYVTTPICLKLLTSALPIKSMALMLQKEAADRFFAQPSSRQYGPLSVLARYYYDVSPLMSLSPQSYYPQPEVDSSVILLTRKKDAALLPLLPRALDAAFAMRRKTMLNNIKAAGFSKEETETLLAEAGIPPSARAEALPTEAFVRLAGAWEKSIHS